LYISEDKMKYYILIFFTLLITGCAQPVAPTGGEKDVDPPRIIRSIPANNSTQNKPKIITIYFNENIQLNNPNQKIIISPSVGKLKISNTNKSITITFPSENLLPNTTYSINLNNSISDINENNEGVYSPILFSTGENLDSLSIFGKIQEYTGTKIKNFKAYCYNKTSLKNNPLYINNIVLKTFTINGLDSLEKNIVAYNDINNNDKADDGDDIAFKTNCYPTKDTVEFQLIATAKTKIGYSTNNSSSKIYGIKNPDLQYLVNLQPAAYIYKDTIFVPVELLDSTLELLSNKYYLKQTTKPEKFQTSAQFTKTYDIGDSSRSMQISFNDRITAINTDNIRCNKTGDSTAIIKIGTYYSNNNLTIITSTTNETYELTIPANTITLSNNIYDKKINVSSESNKSSGNLTLINATKYYTYITIYNNGTSYKLAIKPKDTLELYIPQGTYSLNYFKDTDNDRHITPPDIEMEQPAEQMVMLQNIPVKTGLTNIVILK